MFFSAQLYAALMSCQSYLRQDLYAPKKSVFQHVTTFISHALEKSKAENETDLQEQGNETISNLDTNVVSDAETAELLQKSEKHANVGRDEDPNSGGN